ncbi:MAG: helix-turn-helix domain-containing protein [Pyrinomonadaceae bacterium]
MDGRIFTVVTQINSNLSRKWTADKMAESVGLSVPHFIRLFKEEIKNPPVAYLCEQRLERAKDLLETTFIQIQQICAQVGIPNESHFTRNFKKKYGTTPTEYRRNFYESQQLNSPNGQK